MRHAHTQSLSHTQGMTPLHMAAMNGHTEAMKMLLEGGADVDIKSNR